MRRLRTSWIAILVAVAGGAGAQLPEPEPGVAVPASAPSINSVRPGVIPPGSGDVTITIYGSGFDERLGAVDVLWNDVPLASVDVSDTHPNSRVQAILPASLLAGLDEATVVLRQSVGAAPLDSNPVTITIGEPPDCTQAVGYRRASCGAALGDVPTIEMVPKHVWYAFVAAPAGGVVRAVHRDSLANPEAHTVTSSTVRGRIPLIGGPGDPSFDISLGRGQTGYVRVPENREPGSTIAFWCTQHGNQMNPPFGAILVR